MDRDYADFKNNNLAVFNCRGFTLIRIFKNTKNVEIGENAHLVYLGERDLLLLSYFLKKCYDFITGKINDIENVKLN